MRRSLVVRFSTDENQRFWRLATDHNAPKERAGYAVEYGSSVNTLEGHYLSIKAEHAVAQVMGGVVDTDFYMRGNKGGNVVLPSGLRANAKFRRRRGWDYALKDDTVRTFWGQIGFLVWPEDTAHPLGSVEVMGWISHDEFEAIAQHQTYGGHTALAVKPHQLHGLGETPRLWIPGPEQIQLFGDGLL